VIRRTLALSILSLGSLCLPAQAADLVAIGAISQSDFRLLSEDMGAALSYKPLQPSEPLGVLGFDIGIAATATKLENSANYAAAFSGSLPSSLVVPALRASIGLPLNFDIGASYAAVPDSNIKLWGAELRYAIVEGGTATPSVALRGSYTSMDGVDQLKLTTTGLDVSISKGFAMFTPYAGIGKVWVTSTPDPSSGLVEEDFDLNKVFVGVNMNLAVINIAVEGDKTGDATSYGIKFGWRF